MRQLCAQYDLAGINKDPLNKGILTGKFKPETKFPADDNRTGVDFSQGKYAGRLKLVEDLRKIFTSEGRSMAQGALAYIWALDERMVPIPGFKTLQQVIDNAGALKYGAISSSQLEQVQSIVSSFNQNVPGQ
jgi:aryl-alcohol dehydrogenase-like predicted oxidoreductase